MSIAWKLQSVISAFSSALAGGLMMSRAIYNYCSERNIAFFGMVPNKHEETYIDEIFQYIFAASGFYFQFKLGFDMPFPFNLLLWPLGESLLLSVDIAAAVVISFDAEGYWCFFLSHHRSYFSFYRIWRVLHQMDYHEGYLRRGIVLCLDGRSICACSHRPHLGQSGSPSVLH